MAYAPFGWHNDPLTDTPLDSAELEAFGAHIYNQIPAGPTGPPSVIVQHTAPDPTALPINTLWIETDSETPPGIVGMHVVMAA